MALFQQTLEKNPELPGPHYRMAQHALAQQDTPGARAHLLKELDLDVDDAGTLTSMGSMFLTIGDPDHATQCLLRATGLDKSNADAYYYLGLAAAAKGYFEDAVRFFTRALDLDGTHAAALKDSALAYLAAGKAAKAAELIAKARAAQPKDPELRTLDYNLRLTRLIDRWGRLLRRLRPRRAWSQLRR
jgi:tetratricopeptide (TPR) repeat protein